MKNDSVWCGRRAGDKKQLSMLQLSNTHTQIIDIQTDRLLYPLPTWARVPYQNILQDFCSKIMSHLQAARILPIHARILHVLARILFIFYLARIMQDYVPKSGKNLAC